MKAKLCGTSLAPIGKSFFVTFIERSTNRTYRMLIDTGSDFSFVSDKHSNHFIVTNCKSFSCLSFCGDSQTVSKYCKIEGRIDETDIESKFYIAPLPNNLDFICGSDILYSYGASISYNSSRPQITFKKSNMCLTVHKTDIKHTFNIGDAISDGEQNELIELLNNFSDIFSEGMHDLGKTNVAYHTIDTGNHLPINLHQYKLPHGLKAESNNIINDMLQNGIIKHSKSPWNNPYFLVKKKNGKYRFVLNFRKLNEITKKDAFPIPLIEDIFSDMEGACIFTSLDLANGYWQIALDDSSKEKTAFSANNNHFEFNVMPYGVCNGPSTFQRTIQQVLVGSNCLPPYIDDVVIATNSWEDHRASLTDILTKLKKAGFKLNPEKCSFVKSSIVYLGHLLSKKGIQPDPQKVQSLLKLKAPSNAKETQMVFGFCNYLRSYVPRFAEIMKPISSLLQVKPNQFKWTTEADLAFTSIKEIIANQCLRHFPNFSKSFELSVDASNMAIGATLSQNGAPIIFDSRLLSKAERNYSTTDKEYLALVWAFGKFRQYLVNQKCVVKTDHKPLLGLVKGAPRNQRHARYQQILEEFTFEFAHISGSENILPDTLSRLTKSDDILISSSVVDALAGEIIAAQYNDKECKQIKHCLETNQMFKSPLRCPDQWKLDKDKVLYHSSRMYVPLASRESLINTFHNCGHFGINPTMAKIRQRYIFPKMWGLVRNIIKKCVVCQKEKNYGPVKAPLLHLPDSGPFELVCIDIVGPVKLSGNFKFLLTIIDNYSKWVEAVPLCHIDANSVAKAFVNHWVYRWGPPVVLHSDRGTQFESVVMESVCKILGTKKSRTTAYRPEGNGSLERFHRCLKDRLRCSQRNWKEVLDEVLFEYRITPSVTGEAPIKRLLGFDVPIPSDWPDRFVRGYAEPAVRMLHNTLSNTAKKQKLLNITNPYKIGDKVWIKNLNRTSLESPWKGPYNVLRILGPVTLDIDVLGSIHVNRCKLAF